MNFHKLKMILRNPGLILDFLLRRYSNLFSNDKQYLSLRWFLIYGRRLDWNNPKRFTEKLQWLKVNNRNPLFTIMVDKLKAKEYVASKINDDIIIPLLNVWESADDIDFSLLPDKFVLKCNHDSGTGMCICTDKSKLNYDSVKKGLSIGLSSDYYLINREWPYKNVDRKIFAEKYMEELGDVDLIDYKWYCFNGIPRYCQVIQNRSTNESIDFFDHKWNHMPFVGLNPIASNAKETPAKPQNLLQMLEIAEKLSKDLPFVRIDLYEIKGKVYFGEITFFPLSGFGKFNDDRIDFEFGKLVDLSSIKQVSVQKWRIDRYN